MKKGITILMIATITLLLYSCGGGGSKGTTTPPSTPEELIAKKLEGINWKVVTVLVDGVDYTNLFKNFTINFGNFTYSTTNSPSQIWVSNGTWNFISNTNGYKLMRNDGVEIDISQVDDKSLVFSMTWNKTTYTGSRTSSVSGRHTFTMSK